MISLILTILLFIPVLLMQVSVLIKVTTLFVFKEICVFPAIFLCYVQAAVGLCLIKHDAEFEHGLSRVGIKRAKRQKPCFMIYIHDMRSQQCAFGGIQITV